MSILAIIRPDSWNWALLLHVGGAMILVGGLLTAGAAWIYDKEGFGGSNDPTWVGIGFATADGGGLLMLIALIVGGAGLARARRGTGGRLLHASGVIALVLLVLYVVTVWAMAAKPS